MTDRPLSLNLYQQALRYAGLSVLSFVCNLGLTVLLHEVAHLPSYLAVLIAMAFVTVMNFCTLRLFVFGSDAEAWPRQFAGFVVSILGFRGTEFAAFLLLHQGVAVPYHYAYCLVLVVSLVCKFLFFRGLVFQRTAAVSVCPEVSP